MGLRLLVRRLGRQADAVGPDTGSRLAAAAGLHCVPHAGETTGPETVWAAIDGDAAKDALLAEIDTVLAGHE